MRRLLTSLFFGSVCAFSFAQDQLTVEGHYQGADLYIQNPYTSADTLVFCVDSIHVNGKRVAFLYESAFEIKLTSLGLSPGDPVTILFFHQPGCKPQILNPGPITPKGSFEMVDITVSADTVLYWTAKNEQYEIPYYVETYRWNKWIKAGEVNGNGTPGEHNYSYTLVPHSGVNIVRVTQEDYTGRKKLSQEVRFTSTTAEIKITDVNHDKKQIVLSSATQYELFDSYGHKVKEGFGEMIDCTGLEPGKYFLNYDNTNTKIVLKKSNV